MKLKVLVVDDDLCLLGNMRKVLEKHDHMVKVANDSASARAIIRKWTPDVVFIDVFLGWDNGLDLLLDVREELEDSDLIAMTNYPGSDIMEQAFSYGADGFVGKEELALCLAVLDRLIARRQFAVREIL